MRLHIPPRVVEPDSAVARFYRERKVRLVNSQAEQAALGMTRSRAPIRRAGRDRANDGR